MPRYQLSTLLPISLAMSALMASSLVGQDFNILDFDPTLPGIWSSPERTTLTVPQVPNGSITIDGASSDEEYGGFVGVPVIPGDEQNPAWVLDFPASRTWDNPEDSSFTFWLAHDEDFLYIAAQAKDEVVNVDNDHSQFWKDDSIELIIDALNNRYDEGPGGEGNIGGQTYVTFDGQVSAWDAENGVSNGGGPSLFPHTPWEWGEEGDIFSAGAEVEGGWQNELRIRKSLMEDEEAGNKLVEGYVMGFNIGVDDDDKRGAEGENGSGELERDLELQYWWSNRERFLGWNAAADDGFFTEEEVAQSFAALLDGTVDSDELLSLDHNWGIDSNGRLRGGGTGEIVFGGLVEPAAPTCNAETQGDVDGNGTVEFADFLVVSANFGAAVDSHAAGDLDCNGTVEFADFLVVSANFGNAVAATAVPEPSTMTLGLGACCIALLLRRR